MTGGEGWEAAARRLGASHVFWGHREAEAFRGSTRPWARPEQATEAGDFGTLYALPR
jgi:hypothetical protein